MNLFNLTVTLASLLSFALALPANLESSDDKQQLTVVYHRANSSITVEALSSDGLLGRACSASLDSGIFTNLPSTFDVDERGSGNLTVGPSTYRIHEDINYSGGITCGRVYNDVGVAVSCTVNVPAELLLRRSGELDVAECTPNAFSRLSKTLKADTRTSLGPADKEPAKIVRGTPLCAENATTEVFDHGDPHQNYYNFQLSGRTSCGRTPHCSMSFRERDGVTVSYSTSTDRVEYWIDGGFFVRQEWTTLHDYTCFAETGETVCIWYNVAHTAYTVWNHYVNMCDGNEVHSDPFILFSPNQANYGGGHYCVIGSCRHKGEWWWDLDGPAGDATDQVGGK